MADDLIAADTPVPPCTAKLINTVAICSTEALCVQHGCTDICCGCYVGGLDSAPDITDDTLQQNGT